MSEHAPTPWIIRSQVQVGKNKGGFYLAPDETCSAPAWGSNQANAAFIVKAVNNHDALVKALELQEAAELAHVNCEECDGEEVPEQCQLCFPLYDDARSARRAALASIKEPRTDVEDKGAK